MNNILLFTYGTLKKGFRNHHFLDTATYMGEETISGFKAINYHSFPIAIRVEGTIKGELYKIDEKTLASIDWMEQYPNLYNRAKIETKCGQAYIYFMEEEPKGMSNQYGFIVEWGITEKKKKYRKWVYIPSKYSKHNSGNFRKECNIYFDGKNYYIKINNEWLKVFYNSRYGEYEVLG